jgi:hypothetical protein
MGRRLSTVPTQDALFVILMLVGVVCVIGLIMAMFGAGEANVRDSGTTYMYIAGLGALPWGIAALISFTVASMRARTLKEEREGQR